MSDFVNWKMAAVGAVMGLLGLIVFLTVMVLWPDNHYLDDHGGLEPRDVPKVRGVLFGLLIGVVLQIMLLLRYWPR